MHIQVDPYLSVSEAHYISETVRSKLIKEIEEVIDVMVHIDPEDDEDIKEITKLPLRDVMLQKMQQAWKNVKEAEKIENITMHYLQGKIQIELLLPLTILHNTPPDTDKAVSLAFQEALGEVDEIEKVTIHYH